MIRIENAADHVEALDQVGRWHWDEWGSADPRGSAESWTDRLRTRVGRDRIPLILLAFDDDRLVGAVCLVEHDMPDRPDLAEWTPWVAGTYVAVEHRGQGIGTVLMRHVAKEAARLCVDRLYLYTSTAAGFYDRLGWRRESETRYQGEDVTLMSLDVSLY